MFVNPKLINNKKKLKMFVLKSLLTSKLCVGGQAKLQALTWNAIDL